jgi:glycosyltransferase involved in cell wall biosynthesis
MKEVAKVSVIIPAYNRVNYIDQTISSVLDQSYHNVELIVVDDGSTDGTYEKILSYGDKLTLLTHKNRANKGQSTAINLGLANATGKYIAILDSDDYWGLDKLEIQVSYLEEHPDVGLLYTNGYAVDASGEILYPIYTDSHVEHNEPDNILLDCYILLPQNSLVRKNIYDQLAGFNESYRAAQDHDMLIQIAEKTIFTYLPDKLFYYRVHDDSISKKGQRVRWTNGFKILECAKNRYPYRPSTIRKRKALLNYRLGICCIAEKRRMRAVGHMLTAFILDPVRAIKVATGLEKRN